MELMSIFTSTFVMVFIGELGDKTQIAAGTGTLANLSRVKIIFLSSSLALIAVAGITTFSAGLIPNEYIPTVVKIGGIALIAYGIYLFRIRKDVEDTGEDLVQKSNWMMFFSHFTIVFIAEIGDKTQMFTLGSALENPDYLWIVFIAASSALILVTALTIFGVTKLPKHWIGKIQKLGALIMIVYGIHMLT